MARLVPPTLALPTGLPQPGRAARPTRDRRRHAWTVAVSFIMHAILLAAIVTVARRPEALSDGEAPAYELMFAPPEGQVPPAGQPDAAPDPAPPQPEPQPAAPPPPPPARTNPDSPPGPASPAPDAPPAPDALPAPPAPSTPPAPEAPEAPRPTPAPPAPNPPAPAPDPAPPPPAPPAPEAPPAQPAPPVDAAPAPAPSIQAMLTPEPAPLPPPATPPPAPGVSSGPPQVRLQAPPDDEPPPRPRPFVPPAAPPPPAPRPRPQRPQTAPPPAQLGTLANPMDLNFGPAPRRDVAARANAPRGTVASRSLDLSPGAPRPPDRRDVFFDARAARLGADWEDGLKAYWISHRYYPRQAAENNEDGQVAVEITVNASGKVVSATVKSRSGSQFIDMAAKGTWQNAQLSPLPPELGDRYTFTITIDYILIR